MRSIFRFVDFGKLFSTKPSAVAIVNGSREYPSVHGIVRFYKVQSGVMVRSEFEGLPRGSGPCDSPIFAFHIHSATRALLVAPLIVLIIRTFRERLH